VFRPTVAAKVEGLLFELNMVPITLPEVYNGEVMNYNSATVAVTLYWEAWDEY
jgi:hypothetical protein